MRKSSTLVFSILVSIVACTPTRERRPRKSVAERVALVLEAHTSLREIAEGLRAMSDEPVKSWDGSRPDTRCPSIHHTSGDTGPTPPLMLECGGGPRGGCEMECGGAGCYNSGTWLDDSTWRLVGFMPENPHLFHYQLVWAERRDGGCSTIARAFVDPERDLNWSVYEMSIEIEPDGETKFGEFVVGSPPPPPKRR